MSEAPSTALTVQQRAAVALGASEHEKRLIDLAKQSTEITAIRNAGAYQECHSARMVLKRERVALEKLGAAAREDAVKFSRAVGQEEKRLIGLIAPEEDRLAEIEDAHDRKVEAERQAKVQAEAERVARIRSEIDEIRDAGAPPAGLSSERLQARIDHLTAREIGENYAELKDEALAVLESALAKLRQLHAAAVAHEAEQARIAEERTELGRRRAEQEAREVAEADRRKAEDEERERVVAEARARIEEQERLSRLKIEAQERAARERQEEQDRLAKLKREADERAAAEERTKRDAEERAREDEARKTRQAEEDRLRAERDRLAEEARVQAEKMREANRALEEAQRAQREREEADARRQREEVEAKARAEREAREAAEREDRRKAAELADARESLRLFKEQHGHLPEFGAICREINIYFERQQKRAPAEASA